MKIDITEFLEADYNEAILLWKQIEEVGLDDADSFENTCSFLKRNQGMSFVARHEGKMIGAVLCGHDGRRGYLRHLAVLPEYRGNDIGSNLVKKSLSALSQAGIMKCNIFLFASNVKGKAFWEKTGWFGYNNLELMYQWIKHKNDID